MAAKQNFTFKDDNEEQAVVHQTEAGVIAHLVGTRMGGAVPQDYECTHCTRCACTRATVCTSGGECAIGTGGDSRSATSTAAAASAAETGRSTASATGN